jgi:hypothetical protein
MQTLTLTLYAALPAQVAVRHEERAAVLVTRGHAARRFGPLAVPLLLGPRGGAPVPDPAPAPGPNPAEAHVELRPTSLPQAQASGSSSCGDSASGGTAQGPPNSTTTSGEPGGGGLPWVAEALRASGLKAGGGPTPLAATQHEQKRGELPVYIAPDLQRLHGEWFRAYAYPITDEVRGWWAQ